MNHDSYTAFITYSHADTAVAAWLQAALEAYRPPAKLRAHMAQAGASAPRLGRIFRDREDLSAGGDLQQSIRAALASSEFLIVICSPAAAASPWVNLEIQAFKQTHGQDKIICLLAAGDPATCFPPALEYPAVDESESSLHNGPIAADIRPGGDGRRLAKLKIVAGLLGVGLDTLIQRDAQRRYRRLFAISIASTIGMVIMTVLALLAIDARSREQLRRDEAEDLVEFMLGDLRTRLETVGRLDLLDSVGEKAMQYYARMAPGEHTNRSLGRRARALHLLGEVDDLRGNLDAARTAFEAAYQSTQELVRRSPNDGQRVFNHAQSVYWLGYLDWRLGNYNGAQAAFLEYLTLAGRLALIDAERVDWLVEAGHANLNLGVYLMETAGAHEAINYFEAALQIFKQAMARDSKNTEWPQFAAQAHAWLADACESAGLLARARAERVAETDLYQQLLINDSGNLDIHLSLLIAYRARADIALLQGDTIGAIHDLLQARRLAEELLVVDDANTLTRQVAAVVYANLGEALGYARQATVPANTLAAAAEAASLSKAGSGVPDIITAGGDPAPAMTALATTRLFTQAEALSQGLIELDPNVIEWQLNWHNIALKNIRYQLRHRPDAAVASTERLVLAINQLNNLATSHPTVTEFKFLQAEAHYLLAKTYQGQDASPQMMEHTQTVIDLLATSADSLPPIRMALLSLACDLAGQKPRAAALRERLASINFKHPGFQ